MWKPWQTDSTLRGRELGAAIAAGCLAGLIYAGIPTTELVPDPDPFEGARPETPDPWAKSRRYAETLRAQEGLPYEQPASDDAPVGRIHASVRMVDGDTFWLAGEKIRVADIDTPEVRGRCPAETALAARATARMAALLNARPFELEPIAGRDEDRYGRKLRVVTRDGRSLGDQLVAEGLARTWTGRREPWCN